MKKLKIIKDHEEDFKEAFEKFINNNEHYDVKFCVDDYWYYAFIIYEEKDWLAKNKW